jgi:ribosomal protein S18 acetylase RimI-like enzyme
MSVKIRKAATKDFKGVQRLGRNFYKEAASDPDFGDCVLSKRPSRGRKLKWFTKMLADVRKGDAVYLIADVEGQIAGHCFVKSVEPDSELSHVGELAMLVDGAYRGRGIGGKLLDSTIRQSKRKFEMLRLGVFATNKIAKKLYKSRGFKRFGIEPRAVKRGKRYIDMEYYYLDL